MQNCLKLVFAVDETMKQICLNQCFKYHWNISYRQWRIEGGGVMEELPTPEHASAKGVIPTPEKMIINHFSSI